MRFCVHCGEASDLSKAKFCGGCGQALNSPSPSLEGTEPTALSAPKKTNIVVLVAICATGLLALLAATGSFGGASVDSISSYDVGYQAGQASAGSNTSLFPRVSVLCADDFQYEFNKQDLVYDEYIQGCYDGFWGR